MGQAHDRGGKPKLTASAHLLPFNELDPASFERLCFWLVVKAGYERAEHYGLAGSDQGRDVMAYRRVMGVSQRWHFQAKRMARPTVAALRTEIDKISALAAADPELASVGVVFVLSGTASAALRDSVRTYAAHAHLECEFWARSELDQLVKGHPELLREFFALPPGWDAEAALTGSTPFALPLAPLVFVNRFSELEMLDKARDRAGTSPGPAVVVIRGMHGVGKSAISSYWSNLNRERFPSGALHADYSRRGARGMLDPNEVLADFLRDLGVADIAIPTQFAERYKFYRSVTASKRLLVVLDNENLATQVWNVLPSGPGSVVVVATNHRLDDLAYKGAHVIQLKPLDAVVSRRLLVEMAGVDRISAEPEATDALIQACAGLPLPLCVSAGRLASHPDRSVAWLATKVRTAARRLAALSAEGEHSVQAVFDFAYADLPASAALVYRRLGIHEGPTLTAPVAAALADIDTSDAQRNLELLHDAHLLEMPVDDRFRLHDLLSLHAREIVQQEEAEETRSTARDRLIDWYYAAVRSADHAVVRNRLRLTDAITVDARDVPAFSSSRSALDWFEEERGNVLAALRMAYEAGRLDRVWHIAEALWPFCFNRKLFSEWIESHELAVTAAREIGDIAVEARICSQLARAYNELGQDAQAQELMSVALIAAQNCGVPALHASVLEFQGLCQLREGKAAAALEIFSRSRSMFEACGNARGAALQDYHIGWGLNLLGLPEEAMEPLQRAWTVLSEMRDEVSMGRILVRQGEALGALAEYDDAKQALDAAIDVMARLDIRYEQAEAYETLASIAERRQQVESARGYRMHAHQLYTELGHPRADALLPLLT